MVTAILMKAGQNGIRTLFVPFASVKFRAADLCMPVKCIDGLLRP